MVDSHLPAVPEILATIPIGDPAENPRGGVLDPPVAGVRSQRGCWRRWLSLQLGTNRDRGSFYGTVSASRRSASMLPLSLSGRSGRVRQAKRLYAFEWGDGSLAVMDAWAT